MIDRIFQSHWTLTAVVFALCVIFAFAGSPAAADEFRIGAQLENSTCGTGEWRGTAAWDRDSDDIRGHLKLAVGPNGGCDGQGYEIDALVDYQYEVRGPWFVVAGAGYDRRNRSDEYLPTAENGGAKFFAGNPVEAVSLHIGGGRDFGRNRYVQIVGNVVENRKRAGGNAFPVSVVASWQIGDIELNASTNTQQSQASAAWDLGPITATFAIANGYGKLANPAEPEIIVNGNPATLAGGPATTYSLRLELNL